MKAKLVKESLSNRMEVDEFVQWFDNLIEEYNEILRKDIQFILSVLMNDEVSTDEELNSYLLDNIIEFRKGKVEKNYYLEFIRELLDKRDYFMDFRYAQEITL